MDKKEKIGIDAVRLWAVDKSEEIKLNIKNLDLSSCEDKEKQNKSFLLGMIEALRLIDEETFENNRCNQFYINKSKDYNKDE